MFFTAAAIAFVAINGVSAQSTLSQAASKLSYPPSRGSDPLVSRIGPCQGFEMGGRIEYPLSGGRVSWTNIRDTNSIQLAYSTSSNPTEQSDFKAVGTNLTQSWVGTQCVNGIDFAAEGLNAGDQVTMQYAYRTGPGNWPMFECVDLTLVSTTDFAALNMTIPCTNEVLTTKTKSRANPTLTKLQEEAAAAEAASASASSGSNSGSGSRLSATEAGVVGAMTTLGVGIIALLSLRILGLIAFGKKAAQYNATAAQEQAPRLEKSTSFSTA